MTVIAQNETHLFEVELNGDYIVSYKEIIEKPKGKPIYSTYFQIRENPGYYDAYYKSEGQDNIV